MKPTTAGVLRMAGYLVEILCMAAWFRAGDRDRIFLGTTVGNLLLGGVFVGVVMIFASHLLVKRTRPTRRPPRDFDA